MANLKVIKTKKGHTVAIIVKDGDNRDGINFISENQHPLQVGKNNYRKNEKIKPHRHLNRKITIETTQEMLYIKDGKVKVDLYDANNTKFESLILSTGDLIFFVSGGHGLEILEDTTIIEVKKGPYNGRTQDKKIIE